MGKFPAESVYASGGKVANKRTDTVIRNHSFAIQKSSNRYDCPSVRNIGFELIRNLKFPISIRIDADFSWNRVDLQIKTVSCDIRPAWGTQLFYTVLVALSRIICSTYVFDSSHPLWPGCASSFFFGGFSAVKHIGSFPRLIFGGWSGRI